MVNLFNNTIVKFRNFFGSGRSERSASPCPDDQYADKPSQSPLNPPAVISKDEWLGYDDNYYVPEDEYIEPNDCSVPEDDFVEYDDDCWVSENDSVEDDNFLVLTDDLVEYDYSVNTMLPSYGEATEVLENAANYDASYSGCYCDHYSLRLPNRDFLDQPDASHSINGDLNAELLSPLTLTPIHDNICYHLSFNHLNSILRRRLPGVDKALIPELSYHDGCTSKRCTTYDWLSEIYFVKGTFLQRQQIRCSIYLDKHSSSPMPEYFEGCPHQGLTISVPNIGYNGDMFEVQTQVTNDPPRCASHPSKMWKSSEGPYAQMTVCTICHSDAECTLQIEGNYLTIRYTCYRDLGSGRSPGDHKWLALLAGEGAPHRREGELSLYARVWKTALDLKRVGLYEVTHQTPSGLFNMGTEKFRK